MIQKQPQPVPNLPVPDAPRASRRPVGLLLRFLIFAGWVAMVDLWLVRHLGSSLSDPYALIGVPTVGFFFSSILGYLLEKDEKESIGQFFKSAFRAWLSWPLLFTLYALALIAGLLVSSITVVPPAHDDQQRGVFLRWLGEAQSTEIGHVVDAGKPLTEVVFINPFGAQLLVEVDGYLPKLTRVSPFMGGTVMVERDLQALPTLLFRPAVEVKSSIGSFPNGKGCFLAYRKGVDGKPERLGASSVPDSAYHLGPVRNPPAGALERWRLELSARSAQSEVISKTMLAWLKRTAVAANQHVKPGDMIEVMVVSRAGKVVARHALRVPREEFVDIRLERSENGGLAPCGDHCCDSQ